jgi:hypothetical protein
MSAFFFAFDDRLRERELHFDRLKRLPEQRLFG